MTEINFYLVFFYHINYELNTIYNKIIVKKIFKGLL
jgi:hypothetical protein